MSNCNPCEVCVNTEPLNICMDSLVIDGMPINTQVTLTFESMADGATLVASGTTDGTGALTIEPPDIPAFVTGVKYKLTPSETWDHGPCAILEFKAFTSGGQWVVAETNTVTPCN